MTQKMPTLAKIGSALRVKMAETVGNAAVILPPNADANPDAGEILVIHAVNPGSVSGAEMGERAGCSIQSGVYSINLSYPKDSLARENEAWNLAQKLMEAFRMESLEAGQGLLFIEDPYTTNVGISPDGRLSILVTVPWWTLTGGEGE